MNAPLITIYNRILDNATGEILTDWSEYDESILYYGYCLSNLGGESSYVLETQIWNNEDSWNAGMYDYYCENAINCNFSIIPYDNSVNLYKLGGFVYGRCITTDLRAPFKKIPPTGYLPDFHGTIHPENKNILYGCGDHCTIQTKLIIPKNTALADNKNYQFYLAFSYEY